MISYEKGLVLLKKYNLPENIVRHCVAVAQTCKLAATKIKQKNPNLEIDVDLIELSGLLHDIGRSVTHNWEHAYESGNILQKEGLDEIASIVRVHGEFILPEKNIEDYNLNQQLVIFSDSITEYTRMSIDERLKGVLERRIKSGQLKEAKLLSECIVKEKKLVKKIEKLMGGPLD